MSLKDGEPISDAELAEATEKLHWEIVNDTHDPHWRHVVPLGDLSPHVTDGAVECWCHPTNDDGVIIHNSADKRELYERGEALVA